MEFNKYAPKELSWLAFNARVLQEADKPTVPLNERIKFLGIYSNNLDEFFRVRVAILRRLASLGGKQKIDGINPNEILKQINTIVMQQSLEFGRIYESIIADLEKENIFIINEKQLNEEQGAFVRDYL
jgi:polyphosphate kinase